MLWLVIAGVLYGLFLCKRTDVYIGPVAALCARALIGVAAVVFFYCICRGFTEIGVLRGR
jgi:hypothetical protein